jgi:hypothetical protein
MKKFKINVVSFRRSHVQDIDVTDLESYYEKDAHGGVVITYYGDNGEISTKGKTFNRHSAQYITRLIGIDINVKDI